MPKIEFFKEIKIDKNPEIIKEIINLYWKIFIEKNKKEKSLVFVKRPEIIKNSKYNRRNCYKHLRHLLIKDIFIEEENYIIPSSLIFKIDKKIINPSEIIFNIKIDKKIINESIIEIQPSISITKIKELSKLIKIKNKTLNNFISIISDISEKISFSTSFRLNNLPKTKEIIGLWNQKNKTIARKEKELFRILNPNKDPFDHNSFMELRNDDSPLFELEENTRNYIIAGWASRFLNLKKDIGIIGDYINKEKTGTKMLFYDKDKKFLCERYIVFPSSKEGIPLGDMSSLIFTRKNYIKNLNPDYIGYYDFKNYNGNILNHSIIHFAKFQIPEKAKFMRTSTQIDGYITMINIFPADKMDINFIKKRINNLGNGKFIQDNFFPLQYINIPSINMKEFKRINKIFNKASFEYSKKKQFLLQSALSRLIDYSYYFNAKALKLIKKNIDMKNLISMMFTINEGITYISYCLIRCPEDLNKKIKRTIRKIEEFYQKITPILINRMNLLNMGDFFQAKYSKFILLSGKKDFSLLDKRMKSFLSEVEIIREPFNKLRAIDALINIIKEKIKEDSFSEKTKKYLDYIIELNNKRARIFDELALKIIKYKDEKGFNKNYIEAKYRFYETLSLYYKYQNILYKTEYYKNSSEDKEKFEDLKLILEEFKNKIL